MPVTKFPWCVFVSGSRDLTWDKHYVLVRDTLRPFFREGVSVVIHGDGPGRTKQIPGCDKIAGRVGEQFATRVYAIPALWLEQGNVAGPIRNRLCVDFWVAHHRAGYRLAMVAFNTGGSGTADALRQAKNLSAGLERVQIEDISVTL